MKATTSIFSSTTLNCSVIDHPKSHLHFETMPSDYLGDGLRFQKFAFEDVGEIDFIVAGALTTKPF